MMNREERIESINKAQEKEMKAGKVEKILKIAGVEGSVNYRSIWKNNGFVDAMTFTPVEGNVSPTVYFAEETEEWIAEQLKKAASDNLPTLDLTEIFSAEYFYENLSARLIPDTVENRNGLEMSGIEYVTINELSLILTLEVMVDYFTPGGSIQLTRKHLDMAGWTFSEAMDRAIHNIGEEAEVKSMQAIIKEMLPPEMAEEVPDEFYEDQIPMYVLTNKKRRYGAAAIMSAKAHDMIMENLDTVEYYILPSSVHEVIIIPKRSEDDTKQLLEIVKEVNATQVDPVDKLADAVYVAILGKVRKVA